MRRVFFGVVPLLAMVASCGTPEFRAERQICEADWLQKIPPRHEQRLVTRIRQEQRPTGQVTCTTIGTTTNCTQVMTTISIPYTAIETVDVNAAQRDPQIEACAARVCQQKFGNPECKSAN